MTRERIEQLWSFWAGRLSGLEKQPDADQHELQIVRDTIEALRAAYEYAPVQMLLPLSEEKKQQLRSALGKGEGR